MPPFSVHTKDCPQQVPVEIGEGLKYSSSVYCDELVSIPKTVISNYIDTLSEQKLDQVNRALATVLAIKQAEG